MVIETQPTSRLMVLLFTDVIGSVNLKHKLGMGRYAEVIGRHDRIFQDVIDSEPGSRILKDTGDGYLASFPTPSHAVEAALKFQYMLANEDWGEFPLQVRVGIHQGEVTELDQDAFGQTKIVGLAADIAARIMELGGAQQILITRPIFDDARQYLREHPTVDNLPKGPALQWMAHGPYLFHGHEELIDVYEVGPVGIAPLSAPPDSKKARRAVTVGDEEALGWRPAVELEIPHRPGWILERQLGVGGFGEVWLGKQRETSERRVFKFCFDNDRRRSLRREVRLMRLIRDELGERNDIARLHDMQLDEPPFFLEMEYTEEGSLPDWAERQGGINRVPMLTRLDVLIRVCEAVAAAHSVGILHKDIKPSNILVYTAEDGSPRPRLADFGIGILTEIPDDEFALTTGTGVTASILTGMHMTESGTRLYLPPETLIGQMFTERGDVYALGVVLFQMVVGDFRRPLGAGWERQVDDPVLRELIAECVDVDPNQRIETPKDLANRIRNLDDRRQELEFMAQARDETRRRVADEERRRSRRQWRLLTINLLALLVLALLILQNTTSVLSGLFTDPGADGVSPAPPVAVNPGAGKDNGNSNGGTTGNPGNPGNGDPETLGPDELPDDPPTNIAPDDPRVAESREEQQMASIVSTWLYRKNLARAEDALNKLKNRFPEHSQLRSLEQRVQGMQQDRAQRLRAASDALDDRNLAQARGTVNAFLQSYPDEPQTPELRMRLSRLEDEHDRLVEPVESALDQKQIRVAQASLDKLRVAFPDSERVKQLQGRIDSMQVEMDMMSEQVTASLNRDDARSARHYLNQLRSKYPNHDALVELEQKTGMLQSAIDKFVDPVEKGLQDKDPIAAAAALEKLAEAFPREPRVPQLREQLLRQQRESEKLVTEIRTAVDAGRIRDAQSSLEDLRVRFPSHSQLAELRESVQSMLNPQAMAAMLKAFEGGDREAARSAMNQLTTGMDGAQPLLRAVLIGLAHERRDATDPVQRRIAVAALDELLRLEPTQDQIALAQEMRQELRDAVALPARYGQGQTVQPSPTQRLVSLEFVGADRLISVDQEGQVRFWDARSRQAAGQPVMLGHSARIDSAAISRQGEVIVVADGRVVRLYQRVAAGYNGQPLPNAAEGFGEVAVDAEAGRRLIAWGRDGRVGIWDLANRKPLNAVMLLDEPTAGAVSPTGNSLAVGDRQGKVTLFNGENGEQGQVIEQPNMGAVESIAYGPDGFELAVGYRNGNVGIYNMLTKKWTDPGGNANWQRVDAMAYRFDGRLLWGSETRDGFLKIGSAGAPAWSTFTPVGLLAVSPDGNYVATWADRRSISIFPVAK